MSHPINKPTVKRPLTNLDVSPPGVTAEGAAQTKIGRFQLPTESLRAYTMLFALVVIWVFFQWATIDARYPYGLFLNPINFSKLLQQMAVTGVLAVGSSYTKVASRANSNAPKQHPKRSWPARVDIQSTA